MTIEELMAHVQATRETAIEMVLNSVESSVKTSEFLNHERDSVCSTQEEKDEWDLAFIHQKEGIEAVKALIEEARKNRSAHQEGSSSPSI